MEQSEVCFSLIYRMNLEKMEMELFEILSRRQRTIIFVGRYENILMEEI